MALEGRQFRAFALLGLVMLFWAGNAIVARAVHEQVPPFTLAFIRWTGAFAFVAPFALAPLRRDRAALVAGWKEVLLLGLLGVGAFNALLYSGLQYSTATNALLIQAAIPATVVIFDRMFFGARSGGLQAVGTLASIIGVLVIVFEGDPAAAMRLHLGTGDLYLLAAVVVWSLYTVLLRLRPAMSGTSFIAATFAIGVASMAPFAAWEWSNDLRIIWGWGVAGALLYVSLLPSLVSYFIYNHAAEVVGPVRAGQAITLMPVFGAFISVILLGEALHPYHVLGIGLIVAGIVLGALALRGRNAGKGSGGARQVRSLEG